jgi:hypothetical protein
MFVEAEVTFHFMNDIALAGVHDVRVETASFLLNWISEFTASPIFRDDDFASVVSDHAIQTLNERLLSVVRDFRTGNKSGFIAGQRGRRILSHIFSLRLMTGNSSKPTTDGLISPVKSLGH